MPAWLATSRYTFRLPLRDGFGLYNANTGAAIHLKGRDTDELSALLSGPPTVVDASLFPDDLSARLRRGGFLVGADDDELAVIRERYWSARSNAPVTLLITTTMECNLGCYYCYESRSPEALRIDDVDGIVAIARELLSHAAKPSLHVDWYGGEPLLNAALIEAASLALQALCDSLQINYHASVVSNGTLWPTDVEGFVARHRIRQVQISFDGMKANHDRRRHYRRDYRPPAAASSFDRAVRLVDRLLQYTRVDLRFNADPGNAQDFSSFLDFAESRGWFDAPFRCVILPARLQAFSERSEFMRRRELTDEEFHAIQEEARRRLPTAAQDEQDIAGFLFPMTSVCGALARNSAVVGADGLEYRCGLQVGERHRAVGRFGAQDQDADEFPDRAWWNTFDPTEQPTCSRCSFLPLCWGGCPKRHLDGSQVDIDREGRYWRTNLPRMIAAGFDVAAPAGFAYAQTDQFRDGPSGE